LYIIKSSCGWNGWGPNNNNTETQTIHDSIKDESQKSGVPKEFILAIMMQESKGCVRAPTSESDAHNPGLMQGAGSASCNPHNGGPIIPCPPSTIAAMIHEGTAGEGLRTTLKESLDFVTKNGTTDDSKYYKAARRYNSGSQVTDLNLGVSVTKCYASDIANRLLAPFSESGCNDNTVATLTKTEGRTDSQALPQNRVANGQKENNTPVDDSTNVQQNSDGGIMDAGVTGAVDGCKKYYTPTQGNSCEAAGVDFAKLRQLNSKLNGDCSNMWTGYKYCIAK
jgi:hypothetical protein